MLTEKGQEGTKKFSCTYCNHITCNKNKYERHLLTRKHLFNKYLKEKGQNGLSQQISFPCINCNKIYKSRVGLWQHSKKCSKNSEKNIIDNPIIDTNIVVELIKQNNELQNLLIQQSNDHQNLLIQQSTVHQKENKELMNKMVEITQQQMTIPNSTTINNNNNQTFNLNLFLNETCKDAMNINEFIENIKITFEELLTIGNTGFVNGLSDIFVKRLRDLEIEKRPIHCTDSKRETIYFKENNEWSKDDKENKKLKGIIEKVEYKNVAALHNWCNENPDSKTNNTPNNLLRDKIYLQTLQGDDKTRDRIIKNISKEVIVEK